MFTNAENITGSPAPAHVVLPGHHRLCLAAEAVACRNSPRRSTPAASRREYYLYEYTFRFTGKHIKKPGDFCSIRLCNRMFWPIAFRTSNSRPTHIAQAYSSPNNSFAKRLPPFAQCQIPSPGTHANLLSSFGQITTSFCWHLSIWDPTLARLK